MALFRRNKNKMKGGPSKSEPGSDESDSESRVGVVSSILSPHDDSRDTSSIEGLVERRFGPDPSRQVDPSRPAELRHVALEVDSVEAGDMSDKFEAAQTLLDDESDSLNLEIDPMAHIGNATTIIGNIVADEDLEIQGTIEGSVELAGHRVIVGSEGVVKASVHARAVEVIGEITGNVIATELVEIKAGGLIGGDIKAPRVIMNDGAIVVGGLDMSAALSGREVPSKEEFALPDRPKLIKVELTNALSSEEGSA